MKNTIVIAIALLFSLNSFAQETRETAEEETSGFKKDHLFTGGGIQLSYSNYTFIGGASPLFGYSFNKWFDAGIGLNFTYASNSHILYAYTDQNGYATGELLRSDDKARQTIAGPLVFAKFYPVKFLFIQAQGEANFISQKIIYVDGFVERHHYSAPSMLLGAGYCSGRETVGDLFYYISLSIDVLKRRNSPYVEEISNGHINILPVIRAGLQIPLFQGKRK